MAAKILIVDDEPKWINFAEYNLGVAFNVEVATNLEAALVELNEKGYDLIIVSSRRVDVLQALKREYPGLKVVVATGQPTTREAIKMYRFGVLDYFAKELKIESISQRIYDTIQKAVRVPA